MNNLYGQGWKRLKRPGYFGKRRDEKVAALDTEFGKGNWTLAWCTERANALADDLALGFEDACKHFYEDSYHLYLMHNPEIVRFVCSFGECIDNAPTNVQSGRDYTKQEAASTHIQDIAVRNVLYRMSLAFTGPVTEILTIRGSDSNGSILNPGRVPFADMSRIQQPSKTPRWAGAGSVEDFWQSNKWVMVR
jgi:hypothetical protein